MNSQPLLQNITGVTLIQQNRGRLCTKHEQEEENDSNACFKALYLDGMKERRENRRCVSADSTLSQNHLVGPIHCDKKGSSCSRDFIILYFKCISYYWIQRDDDVAFPHIIDIPSFHNFYFIPLMWIGPWDQQMKSEVFTWQQWHTKTLTHWKQLHKDFHAVMG